MLCQFERLIYPKETVSGSNAFMIALYRPCEEIVDSGGNRLTQITAVGYCLPVTAQLQYEMQGRWSKDPKHGIQFEVENYDEVISPTREGIVYRSSGTRIPRRNVV